MKCKIDGLLNLECNLNEITFFLFFSFFFFADIDFDIEIGVG